MATILQQPDQHSFAGNIKNIIVTTEVRIIFKLKHGSEVLFESSYDPDLNDKVEIDIKKIIQDVLTSDIPVVGEVTTRDFSSFSFIIDEGAEQFFYAFEGGVDTIIDSSWFAENFLTWQPQTSYVTWSQPQFLSYIALQVCNFKIKGYFSDGTDQTVSFGAFTANKINTANLQFSSLPSKFAGKQPQYVDVWTEDAQGARLSYIQRFVLKNSSTDDNSFLFKNSLGGWDSVVFSGTLKNEASSDVKTFSQEDATNEYQVDLTEKYSKNTGYFLSEKHRIWISEFFKTSERYYLSQRGYFEKLTVLSSTINSQKSNPSSYNFTFSLSRTTKYLNLSRVESPESPIEIVDPTGELFFLAPRLVEFPSAEFVDNFLLPVQSPYLQEWKKITLGVVKGTILDYIRSQISPGIPQSLLDLSDIDPSLEMANVGAYMVKLASGKWGPGSVSIDLSNYFNKGESDERYSFKSHSHDYVPTATFNSHAGDSVKHTTQEDKDKIIAAYNDKHTHNNKANLDTINQDLSKSSSVEFADLVSAGSVAFYGGTGGGSTPASSLLNLSDIDSSLATAAVGSPLVKLANGKWGPGSVSIDLTNYFTKEESDARFAFKSHSHDYVAPSAFNAHTGDTTKHITSAERVAWNAKESALGNPDVDGKILASTAGGVRSWVSRYVLPVAAAAMLGGVMIGANVNVDAQGRISVAAPYSHPATHPASMIDESATRRFLTDAERANWNDSYDKRHTHGNKANLDSINQNLSQTSNVKFNDVIADGSVGFYGGVGSGSTPVASLLDLSDIDASISAAATGTPLVKLANGKWGAGSVSIDLSNYYNKSDADARYAFKSHSHDYVTTGVFNGHTHAYLPLGGGKLTNQLIIETTSYNAFNEGIRLNRSVNSWSGIVFGGAPGSTSGCVDGEWFVARASNGTFAIIPGASETSLGFNLVSGGDAKWRNNILLHAGNYTTYAAAASHNHNGTYALLAGSTGQAFSVSSLTMNGALSGATTGSFSGNVSAASFTSGGNAVIHSGNIGSQSVNYATSAGNADTLDTYHASYFATASQMNAANLTSGYLPYWNGSSLVNSGIKQSNESIGIDNLYPVGKLFIGPNWRTSHGGTNLYVGGNTSVSSTADLGITYAISDSTTLSPAKVGLTLYNDDTSAGGWSPLLLFAKAESGATPYKATMAGIAAKSPTGTGTGDTWIDGELHFYTAGYATSGIVDRMVLNRDGNLGLGYFSGAVLDNYKLAVNGPTYFNGPSTINGALAIAGAFTGATTVVASSYIQGAYYKLGNWEIKQNASGELEFILSGSLKFKITSAGIVSSGGVAFYS